VKYFLLHRFYESSSIFKALNDRAAQHVYRYLAALKFSKICAKAIEVNWTRRLTAIRPFSGMSELSAALARQAEYSEEAQCRASVVERRHVTNFWDRTLEVLLF